MVGRGEFMDIHEAWVKGKSVSEIARVTGRDRKTIRRLLQGKAPAERKPRQVASKLDRFREYLLSRMLGDDPVTNAEVLFDEIREQGYDGGRSILKEFMAPLREVSASQDHRTFRDATRSTGAGGLGHVQEARAQAGAGLCHDAGLVAHDVPRLHRHSSAGFFPRLS